MQSFPENVQVSFFLPRVALDKTTVHKAFCRVEHLYIARSFSNCPKSALGIICN